MKFTQTISENAQTSAFFSRLPTGAELTLEPVQQQGTELCGVSLATGKLTLGGKSWEYRGNIMELWNIMG
jgi:hypothetical protein